MTNFRIEIVSDTVCPWCFVGQKRLEKGIAKYKETHPNTQDTFSVSWLPFYLNPDAPKTGIDKAQYYYQKFGEQRSRMMFDRLAALGREDGINFKFGGKTGNTRDSHRLIQLATTKSPETQDKVVNALFQAYFEDEQDITSHEVLLQAGVKAGLQDAEVKEWLSSEKGGPQVDKEVRQAQTRTISGVPHFTIQDKYELGGAQEPEAFVEIFEKVKARDAAKRSQ